MTPPSTVLHIPHASTRVPAEVRGTLLLDDHALVAELLRVTDAYTDELFRVAPELATAVVYPVSRLVVDPERPATSANRRGPRAERAMMLATRASRPNGEVVDLRRPGSR